MAKGNVEKLSEGSQADAIIVGRQWSQSAGGSESGIGRIGEPVPATNGGNLKQNGIVIGKTTFPKPGRRLSIDQ